jgi:hypothetical protein
MSMTPELQLYYEQRLSMMGEPAWKDLMEDVEQMLSATNDLSAVQDEKTLHFRRGEISIMRWMLSLKDVSEQAYQQLKDEDATAN